ncbi:MAG: addiction module protein [Cellulomonadaceae bacterium]|nr:addiction module protein [Cellulomonadaceae bacterium]
MSLVADDVRRGLYQLPINERLALANEVITEFEAQREFEKEWSGEVRTRIDDILDGGVKLIPGDVVFAEARERIAAKWS